MEYVGGGAFNRLRSRVNSMQTAAGCAHGAVFAAVYISEAHAADEWPVGKRISFCDQPTSLPERVGLARRFQSRFAPALATSAAAPLELLVDNMDNQFNDTFGAWPFRLFVIDGRDYKLLYKAQPDARTYTYSTQALEEWLEQHLSNQ